MTLVSFLLIFAGGAFLGHIVTAFQFRFLMKHSLELRGIVFEWWATFATQREIIQVREILGLMPGENESYGERQEPR